MTLRFRRRPDDWPSPHDRARALAAERLDQPIDIVENGWLEGHLADCADCAAIAGAYSAQRAELRALAADPPSPPRDLWARTAAAIEREAAAGSRGPARRRRAHPSAAPLAALSGLLVIAIVVGASLLSRPPVRPATLTPTDVAISLAPTGSPSVRATPFDVAAANVGWMKLGVDGRIDVYDTPVARVCPSGEGADCPPIEEPTPRSIQLTEPPVSVTKSPRDQGLVVVDANTKSAGGGVYVLPAANATSTPAPSASASPTESAAATASPRPTPTHTATPRPSPPATVEPSVTTTPRPTPVPTPTPGSTVAASPASPSLPSATASVRVTASPTTGTIQIARDVVVVGESEAYSPDGAWFAFSARPADGSHGPDIFAWRPGDPVATAITKDHRSVFAAWLGSRILGSRGVPTTEPTKLRPEAFLIDPATAAETVVTGAAIWRPSVDPLLRYAVYWDGSLQVNEAGTEITPADGRLVLGTWTGEAGGPATPTNPPSEPPSSPSTSPAASESPAGAGSATTSPAEATASAAAAAPLSPENAASQEPASSALPSSSSSVARGRSIVPVDLASGPVRDWDARWDETGTHLAVWIATEGDPRIGDLMLYAVDPATGRLQTLSRVAALAGFSIGRGRLAWATPKGQDGAGNRVQVVAWTKDSVGSVESRESTEVLVVIR